METRSSQRGRAGLGGPAITPHGRRNGSASSSRSGINDDDFVHDDNARTPSQSTKHTPKHSYAAAASRGAASRGKHPVSAREGGDNPKGRPDGQAPIANDVSGVKTNDDKQQVDDQAWTNSKLSPSSLLDRASSPSWHRQFVRASEVARASPTAPRSPRSSRTPAPTAPSVAQ